jgi:Tol biopolymer transport system component
MVIARTRTLVMAVSLSSVGLAQVSLVSTNSSGGNFGGYVEEPSCSSDGRYVAFDVIYSPTLADGVYVKDRQTGALSPVSLPAGGGSTAAARYPVISADGRVVAFTSSVALTAHSTNPMSHVYVRDLVAGTTECVSVSSSGAPGNGVSGLASISGDGRFVALESLASNLVPNDTNGTYDAFVHDRASGTTQLVSANLAGNPGAGTSHCPLISGDGRWVAFQSTANDLVLPDNFTNAPEVYARDLLTGTTIRVSLASTGVQVRGEFSSPSSYFTLPCGGISNDGRWITFVGDTKVDANYPTFGGVYLRDTVAGTTQLVSVPPPGTVQAYGTDGGRMSSDARFVTYNTYDKMTPDDANQQSDVFVRDMLLDTTTRLSPELPGQLNGWFENSGVAVITGDGAHVFFQSSSPKLTTNDTESYTDIFAFDWSQVAPVAYCTAGVSAQGCVATLSSTGNPSGSAGSGFTLSISGADGQRSGLIVYGVGGRQALPWGPSSFACVAPPRQRSGSSSTGGISGTCSGSFSVDWNAFIAAHGSALGAPVVALTPVQAQAYVRDPLSAGGSVLSNAIDFYALP